MYTYVPITLAYACIYHMARHPFGMMALGSGVLMEGIAKMMGQHQLHSNLRSIYRLKDKRGRGLIDG